MLRGIPGLLLASSTGIPFPEEIEKSSVNILKQYLCHTQAALSDGVAGLIAYHICAANLFLHRLSKTLVLRIPIKRHVPGTVVPSVLAKNDGLMVHRINVEAPVNSTPQQITTPQSSIPNLLVDQPSLVDFPSLLEATPASNEAQRVAHDMQSDGCNVYQESVEPAKLLESEQQIYDIAFCTDHGHVNMPKALPRSIELVDEIWIPPYKCPEPFQCVSYHVGPWAALFRLNDFLMELYKDQLTSSSKLFNTAQRKDVSPPPVSLFQPYHKGLAKHEMDLNLTQSATPIDPIEEQDQMESSSKETTEDVTQCQKLLDEIWNKPYPNIFCTKSTLMFVGYGTDTKAPFYNIRLNQISSKRPTDDELRNAARVLLNGRNEKFSMVEIGKYELESSKPIT